MKTYKLNNLRKAIVKEQKKHLKDSIDMLKELETVKAIKSDWRAKNHLTPFSLKKDWKSVGELKSYIVKRMTESRQKEIEAKIKHFETVLNSGVLIEATISTVWKNNATWGANPTSEIKFTFENLDGQKEYGFFEGSSIGGCGYDKASTSVSEVVNMVNPILRSLYIKKNAKTNLKNGDIFGYGAGYGITPRLEGGVGVSCYPRIFESIGYEFKTIASGKNFDVYTITKK